MGPNPLAQPSVSLSHFSRRSLASEWKARRERTRCTQRTDRECGGYTSDRDYTGSVARCESFHPLLSLPFGNANAGRHPPSCTIVLTVPAPFFSFLSRVPDVNDVGHSGNDD